MGGLPYYGYQMYSAPWDNTYSVRVWYGSTYIAATTSSQYIPMGGEFYKIEIHLDITAQEIYFDLFSDDGTKLLTSSTQTVDTAIPNGQQMQVKVTGGYFVKNVMLTGGVPQPQTPLIFTEAADAAYLDGVSTLPTQVVSQFFSASGAYTLSAEVKANTNGHINSMILFQTSEGLPYYGYQMYSAPWDNTYSVRVWYGSTYIAATTSSQYIPMGGEFYKIEIHLDITAQEIYFDLFSDDGTKLLTSSTQTVDTAIPNCQQM